MSGRLQLAIWLALAALCAGVGTWAYVTRDQVAERREAANPTLRSAVMDESEVEEPTVPGARRPPGRKAVAEPAPKPEAPAESHRELVVPLPSGPEAPSGQGETVAPEAVAPETIAPETVVPEAPADPATAAAEVPPAESSPPETSATERTLLKEPIRASTEIDRALTAAGMSPVDVSLLEPGPDGPLPIIGPDGRTPWKTYSRSFDPADGRPRIALVIAGLGLSRVTASAAIRELPGVVTLSFAPWTHDLERWIQLARVAGHEALLDLPMEPIGFPRNDPGPRALLTDFGARENIERLQWVLSRATGYVGVITHMGSRFTTSEEHLRPILARLRNRGLMFVDSRTAPDSIAARIAGDIQLPHASSDRFIDAETTAEAIDRRLEDLEEVAQRTGVALGVGLPYPVTIERVSAWASSVEERGFSLVPVSAIADLQADR